MPSKKSALQLKRDRIKRNLDIVNQRAEAYRQILANNISTENIQNAPTDTKAYTKAD